MKARGIYVALELQSVRRFRAEDGVADVGQLPPGGGPAAVFDPTIGKLALGSARALLEHVNPETGLALRDDPVLAWVTLAGEISLFDLIEDPHGLPPHYAEALRELAAQSPAGAGRRFWQAVEAEHWKEMADALRAGQAAGADRGRLALAARARVRRRAGGGGPRPDRRPALLGPALVDRARAPVDPLEPRRRARRGRGRKRKTDRPYVVGQWCDQTQGAWAFPYEAADLLLGVADRAGRGLGRPGPPRRLPPSPGLGANAAGTGGGEDIFQIPEVVNGIPPDLRALAARRLDPAPGPPGGGEQRAPPRAAPRDPAPVRAHPRLGPDARAARHRHPVHPGIAGWPGGEPANFDPAQDHDRRALRGRRRLVGGPRADRDQQAAARLGDGAGRADRLPLGRRLEARRGRPRPPPLLQEPVRAKVLWRHKGPVKAFALDNTGARVAPATLEETPDGFALILDGKTPSTIHWELVAE